MAWKKAVQFGYRVYAAYGDNGQLLAVLGLTELHDPMDALPSFRLNNFIVAADCRGQGIGSEIIKRVEQIARSEKGKYLLLEVLPHNEKAIRFYNEQLGYQYVCNRMLKELRSE